MRELFIDELAQVTGGMQCPVDCVTTDGCCEEGPYELCCVLQDVREVVSKLLPG